MLFGFIGFSQTTPTAVTPDAYISEPYYKVIWGTTADTLTNADTLTFVYRVRGSQTMDINMKLYNDRISGTVAGTLISYQSIDGVNYEATGDTITVSTASDAMDSEELDLDNFNYPYLKLIFLQSGTSVEVPKVFVYGKYN